MSTIGHGFGDASKAREFFLKVLTARERLGKEAALCIDMDVVLSNIQLGSSADAKILLDSSKDTLAKISTTETVVYSSFYYALAEFYKVIELYCYTFFLDNFFFLIFLLFLRYHIRSTDLTTSYTRRL